MMLITVNVEMMNFTWILPLVGHLHPLFVHFPIALLIVALFFEILESRGKQQGLRKAIYWLVLLGVISAIGSVLAGLSLEASENYSGDAIYYHKLMGIGTLILSIISFVFLKKEAKSDFQKLKTFRIFLSLTVVFLITAGHQGALLTHGSDYITSVLPWNEAYYDLEKTSALYIEISNQQDSLSPDQLDRLNLEVRAIFAHQCYQCHSEHKKEGGLVLENEDMAMIGGENGPVIIPGSANKSEMIRRLELPADHDDVMPQKGKILSNNEINLIRLWIDEGAHWADTEFKVFPEAQLSLSKPKLPKNSREFPNPVDVWVDKHFQENGIEWPERVMDRLFLKRVYMDITGLLPTPEDYDSFLANNSPKKREEVITQLLDREEDYAQHWLSFWNDLLRNDYSGPGYITGGRKQITDWLYNSLLHNKPYDSVVLELINPLPESEGFIKGIQWRGDINSSQSVEMQAAQNIGQSLLGVNLKCASCHNSFISNLKLKQAYDFANIFTDSTLEIYRCGKPLGKTASPAFIYPELGEITGNNRAERLTSLSEIMVKAENGRLYRTFVNRIWGKLLGRGIIERYDEMDNHPWSTELLDWLAADFIESGKNIKDLIANIMSSKAYQLPAVYYDKIENIRSDRYVFRGPLVRRLSAEQFADAVSQVVRPLYHAVSYDPFKTQIPASWIWKREVEFDRDVLPKPGKRYFRYVFNVEPFDNIENADLLISADHSFELFLNGEKCGEGNNWQNVQRYEVASRLQPGKNVIAIEAENEGKVANPAGVLFAMRISNTDTEEVQMIYSGAGWVCTDTVKGEKWKWVDFNDDNWEPVRNQNRGNWGTLVDFSFARDLKIQMVRASLVQLDPFQKALGRPTRENVSTSRESQATLLQALELSNGEFFNGVLEKGAETWVGDWKNGDELGKTLYMKAFGRKPSKEETEVIQKVLGNTTSKEGVQDLFWAVLLLPEFQFIY